MKNKIEKKVDNVQKKIEKIELKEIQSEYKEQVPALVWFLKATIAFGILYNIFLIVDNRIDFIVAAISIGIFTVLLYALTFRRRWGWYYGLSIFFIQILLAFFFYGSLGILALLYWFVPLVLFYFHKDYLNQ